MAKKQGVEAAAERLRSVLEQAEQSMQTLTDEIERDGRQDQHALRDQLGDLCAQARALTEKATGLLERAREAAGTVERMFETANNFVSSFEDVVGGLESAAEALDPQNWEWDERGEA
jgi:chromosome segregation ATPase